MQCSHYRRRQHICHVSSQLRDFLTELHALFNIKERAFGSRESIDGDYQRVKEPCCSPRNIKMSICKWVKTAWIHGNTFLSLLIAHARKSPLCGRCRLTKYLETANCHH